METPTTTARPRKRRRLALSLRAMMLLVLVIGVPLAWVTTRARAQRDAVAEIQRMGHYLIYDYQYADGKEIQGGQSRVPERLRRWLGVDYFHRVTRVAGMGMRPKDLAVILRRLPGMESLWLPHANLSDADLADLPKASGLRDVDLSFVPITDAGVAHLARISHLRSLDLCYTEITDDSIVMLSRCPELEDLNLQGTKITRKGIAALASFPKLRRLNLVSIENKEVLPGLAKLTQLEGLTISSMEDDRLWKLRIEPRPAGPTLWECLRGMPRLRSLSLSWVTADEHLAEVAKLTSLEDLDLSFGHFTDKGLAHLASLSRLKTLKLENTKVTPNGIAAIQLALPSLAITTK